MVLYIFQQSLVRSFPKHMWPNYTIMFQMKKTPNIKSYISQQPLVGSSQRVKNLTYKTEGLRVKDGGWRMEGEWWKVKDGHWGCVPHLKKEYPVTVTDFLFSLSPKFIPKSLEMPEMTRTLISKCFKFVCSHPTLHKLNISIL